MIALYIIGAAALLNSVHMNGDRDRSDAVLFGLFFLILAELWRYFLP